MNIRLAVTVTEAFWAAALVAVGFGFPPASRAAGTLTAVTWSQVRSALEEGVCARVKTIEDDTYVTVIANDRSLCGATEVSPLTRVIDRVFHDAGLALVPLGIDSPVTDEAVTPLEATRSVRAHFLGSSEYLRPVLNRLPAELEKEGLVCTDCPRNPVDELRRVSWEAFFPYLAAHVWPDPVVTPRSADGTPTGPPKYSFHMCAGLNGLQQIANADHLLARAGFLSVMESPALKERASTLFREIRDREEFRKLTDDSARTMFLREQLADALAKDAAVKDGACRTLARRRDDLGLEVEGCSGDPIPPRSNFRLNPPQVAKERPAILALWNLGESKRASRHAPAPPSKRVANQRN